MGKVIAQSTSLAVSFVFVFVWQNSFLSQYTLPLLTILSIIYLFVALRRKNFDLIATMQNQLLGLVILNTVIVLLVMMSGNFSSPLFFLLYFLSLGIAFAYKPAVIFVFTFGIALLLFPYTFKEDVARNLLMIGSLIITAPLVFFFRLVLLVQLVIIGSIIIGSMLMQEAGAVTFSNENYVIQSKDINIQNNISVTSTPDPAAVEILTTPFVFSLSDQFLDFGEVSATNPIIRNTKIGIQLGGVLGYSLHGLEDQEFSSSPNHKIPDTSCDIGGCTDRLSGVWESVLTFGFGYRFEDEFGYRRFANRTKGELPQLIHASQKNEQLKIIYKLNIPATQEKGIYTNTIRYIAVPDF